MSLYAYTIIYFTRMKYDQVHNNNHFEMDLKRVLFERVGAEKINREEDKISWIQSQVIGGGGDVQIDTPFGRRILTYADHTASGRSLHIIEGYITQNVLPYYGNTHTDDSFVGHEMSTASSKASEYIKRCMGGGPDDALIFCGSGATASIKRLQEVLGIAVPSIMRERVVKGLREEERWVVFVGPFEHHSNLLSWRQSLVDVVEIGMDDEGQVDMETLRTELESSKYVNRPMLGSFSACSNVTGVYTNTRALARLLHQHGAFACFDFATSGPYVEIDMRSGEIEGYDAVFLSAHKFLGGPGSPGILLVNKALYQLNTSPPSTCGGGTVRYVNGFNDQDTLYYDGVEEREDAGTPPIIQKIRAALAFWVKDYIGCSLINSYEHVYMETALKRLVPNPNLCVLGSTQIKRLPILSFLVFPSKSSSSSSDDEMTGHETKTSGTKPLHGRFVAKLLNDLFGIQARGGCACAGPYGHRLLGVDQHLSIAIRSAVQKGYEGIKPGWTRVSFSYYMSKEEIAFVMAAIEFIAAHGERFLPLYQFNWKTGTWTLKSQTLKYHLMREDPALLSANTSGELREAAEYAKAGSAYNKDLNWTLKSVHQFTLYMDIAKNIADSLPEDPQPCKAPEDIDLKLVLFRI